jgi:hypothetical protein
MAMLRSTQFGTYNNMGSSLPVERGSLAVHNKYDFFRNLWGVPTDIEQMLQTSPNIQPMDIIGMYKDRALDIPSRQLTAAMWNAQASWLSETACPIFPTSEFNFTSSTREMNMIEYTRTAAGGIPNEQTYRLTNWSDKIEKVQLNARLEMDLSLDANFGAAEWDFQMAGLAANAMLTIYKSIAYSIVHIGYTNLVGENVKHNPYSHARLMAVETEYFGIVPLDPVKFLRMTRRFEQQIPDYDAIIIPHNAVAYIAEQLGESTSMQSQKIVTDPETGALEWRFGVGKKSVGTVTYAEKTVHIVEMPQLRVNMVTDPNREQPLRTSVTLAQVYPADPDVKAGDTIDEDTPLTEANLDFYLYEQKKNQGDEVKVSIKAAYAASHYFDESDSRGDGLSRYAHNFLRFKNAQLTDSNRIPWRYNPANDEHHRAANDVNYESPYDYNTVNMSDIAGKENLNDMKGWRDQFFGITYIPTERIYRLPQRLADFELAAIPPKWMHKSARAIAQAAQRMQGHGYDFDAMFDETMDLLDDIDNTVPTDAYLTALINKNIGKMWDHSQKGAPKFNPSVKEHRAENAASDNKHPRAAALQEWQPNRFGALDLPPKNGNISDELPAGFDSGPGLLTLAKEADKPDSEWRDAGLRAKRVVNFWEMFVRLIRQYVGPTDITDRCLTPPWYHVNSSIAVVIDSVRHYKAPLFLAVPATQYYDASVGDDRNAERMVKSVATSKTNTDAILRTTPPNAERATVLSNLTKFAVILRTYTDTDPIEPERIRRVLEEVAATSAAQKKVLRRLAAIGHKLIDFTINQVYMLENPSAVTLNIIVHYTQKLLAAWQAAANDETAANEIDRALDIYINNNKSSKAADIALKAYEKTRTERDFAEFDQNLPATVAIIQGMKRREAELAAASPITTKPAPSGTVSYDEKVRAANDLDRLPADSTDENVQRRRDAAAAVLGTQTTVLGQAKKPNEAIKIDFDKPDEWRYLRSPLMTSSRILEYLRQTQNPLVKPSDPMLFHEAPLDYATEESLAHGSFMQHPRGANVPECAMPFSQTIKTGLASLSSRVASTKSSAAASYGRGAATASADDLFSTSLKSKQRPIKSSKQMNLDLFKGTTPLSAGGGGFDDDDYSLGELRQRHATRGVDLFQEAVASAEGRDRTRREYAAMDAEHDKHLRRQEFFGPYRARHEYAQKKISSPFVRAIYRALMLAPNRITVHEKLADLGQKLMNVLVFRLFIQHIMSSAIVMKFGRDTMRLAVGHGKVWLNTEQRGINIINSGFYLGVVRTNPNNIAMMPFVFPEGFVGGMGTDFMQDMSHFRNRANERESCIAVLSPVAEVTYEYPLHVLNLPTYKRRDTDNAPHMRKWSSSEFLEFVVGGNTLFEIEGHVDKNKRSYGHAFDISLSCHRGYMRYNDVNRPGHQKIQAGTGPRGNPRMNTSTAWETWNGQTTKFPDMQTDLLRLQ